MNLRLTIIATALTALAMGPVYADGAGGCDYASKYRYTSAEPQEPSDASKKLASLSVPASEQESTTQVAQEQPQAGSAPSAEKTAQ